MTGLRLEERPRDSSDLLFRYTVKCDRDQNKRIEKLAKACGVSPTTYVQRHFESIFSESNAGTRKLSVPAEVDDDAFVLPVGLPAAKRREDSEWEQAERVSVAADRVMAILRKAADADGVVTMSQQEIGERAFCSPQAVRNYVANLVHRKKIAVEQPGATKRAAVYRVLESQPS